MEVVTKSIQAIEEIDEQKLIEKVVITVNMLEYQRRNMDMPVKLTELELGVLQGLVEGRSFKEIQVAIKLHDPKYSYNSVMHRLKKKLDAFTLTHAVYKAVKLGLVQALPKIKTER